MRKEKCYKGNSVQECLNKAAADLGVKIEELEYEILKEKGILKKLFDVKVWIEKEVVDGSIKVEENKIKVKNPENDGAFPILRFEDGIEVIINGEKCNSGIQVSEKDDIKINLIEKEAQRELKINFSPDNMQVYISVEYIPKVIFRLKNEKEKNNFMLTKEVKEEIYPPKFSSEEILKELKGKGVNYGFKYEDLLEIESENKTKNILIAEGKKVVHGIDDELKIFVDTKRVYKRDNNDKVDFKSIGYIKSVDKDYLLCEKVLGFEGRDGIDVFGKVVKCKAGKRINIKASTGCRIEDDCRIYSDIKGRPVIRENTFYVENVYKIDGDVDLKSGNIDFDGNIIICGNVIEGMQVKSNSNIDVYKNVFGANVSAKGDININGKVLFSNIEAGKEDVNIMFLESKLKKLKDNIINFHRVLSEIVSNTVLLRKASVREMIIKLFETHFRSIPHTIKDINSICSFQNFQCDNLLNLLNRKILAFDLNTKEDMIVLEYIQKEIDTVLLNIEQQKILPVDIAVDYAQDSNIKSSGNIYIKGKGEYVSNINAGNSVIFESHNSVARGGTISANNEIKAHIIGSSSGVPTALEVDKTGHIWADVIYSNTKIKVGKIEHVIFEACKQVHAYLDNNNELIIDKLLL